MKLFRDSSGGAKVESLGGSAVPSAATYLGGLAYNPATDAVYVTTDTPSDPTYVGGIAVRNDGALYVTASEPDEPPNIINGIAVSDSGQIHMSASDQGGGSGVVVAPEFAEFVLLDEIQNARAAWSVARKLRSAYAGNAIRVRRSSDSTTQNIGFDSEGDLDESALLSFVGVGDGFIDRIYDQSGNGYSFEQSTAASQPQIVSSGAVLTEGGRPAAVFDGSDDRLAVAGSEDQFEEWHDGSDASLFMVGKVGDAGFQVPLGDNTAEASSGFIVTLKGATDELLYTIQNGDTQESTNPVMHANSDWGPGAAFVLQVITDADNAATSQRIKSYFNAEAASSINTHSGTPSMTASGSELNLGARANGVHPVSGSISELVMYASDQTGNRARIRDQMNRYFSVY